MPVFPGNRRRRRHCSPPVSWGRQTVGGPGATYHTRRGHRHCTGPGSCSESHLMDHLVHEDPRPPVSSDWQISSHFLGVCGGKRNTLSQRGSQKVGWPRPTLARGRNRKSQGPALGNAGGTRCGAGHKILLWHLGAM